ncbi:MAG TPA: sigma-70 family RNA polymerase sigma factor [Polyangia bacterium]|jgi:RNA polymerase sigma-70 factor (ECF subfamily)|nr:sigma-70 family RNA polymerase sigma factor [Polyangia bacterium]
MAHLRSVPAAPPLAQEGECLAAFERELDYLFATLQRMGAARSEIDDLLQEIFMVMYRRWETLDVTRPLRPWLFGVAFRVLRATRRRRAREVLCEEVELQDAAASPEASLQDRESLRILSAAVDRVPSARRSVLVMHDLEGMEIADIARQLSMSKLGIYSRLYKGRRELASALRRLRRRDATT